MMINFASFKKFFLYTLIGTLIASAIVAVVTVLLGEFNSTTSKVFLTLFMVICHSLISLSFIWDDERQNTFDKLVFFTNVTFFLIVMSFITSILGIWEVITGSMLSKLYQIYFIFGFASLHSDILSKALHKEGYLDKIIYSNFVLIAIVVILILPTILLDDASDILGEFYYRILAATGIIDGTLSILTIIFFKLYIHKHPQETSVLLGNDSPTNTGKKGLNLWVWLLIIYLVFQIITPLFFLAANFFM